MSKDLQIINDRQLLKKACYGACTDSLSILYQKYQKPVCDFLNKAGADGLAEDICQAVFMQILDEKCNYDGNSDVRSYLFGIARNLHNQEIASRNTRGLSQKQVKVVGDLIVDRNTQPCPTEVLNIAEMAQIVEKRAEKLPTKARQAVELVFLKGIPAQKAAEIAQCDFKAFRVRLNYGLRFLRENIKK